MDILSDASNGSGSSSVDEAAPMAFRADARLSASVGQCTNLAHFAGQCVWDDMSWKGSKTLRVACLQCGSVGRDRHQWGMWHAHSLTCLGADIGILTETALQSPAVAHLPEEAQEFAVEAAARNDGAHGMNVGGWLASRNG